MQCKCIKVIFHTWMGKNYVRNSLRENHLQHLSVENKVLQNLNSEKIIY